jgi:hypothetical protein
MNVIHEALNPKVFKSINDMEFAHEMRSISNNQVYDLVEISKGAKAVGYKWVYNTKHDSQGNIEIFKARLVAKGFTQK